MLPPRDPTELPPVPPVIEKSPPLPVVEPVPPLKAKLPPCLVAPALPPLKVKLPAACEAEPILPLPLLKVKLPPLPTEPTPPPLPAVMFMFPPDVFDAAIFAFPELIETFPAFPEAIPPEIVKAPPAPGVAPPPLPAERATPPPTETMPPPPFPPVREITPPLPPTPLPPLPPVRAIAPPKPVVEPVPPSTEKATGAFVAAVCDEAPCTDSAANGEVLPMPTLPAKYAVPVVVELPEMVRPAVPLPMVEDAYAVSPPLNWVRVEVEFPAPANGYAAPMVVARSDTC